MLCLITVLLIVISGCSTSNAEITDVNATEMTIPTLDSVEYWEVVKNEIVSMLNQHDLYIDIITNAYPCVQFYVEPGIVTDDGEVVASGLSQAEYEELYDCVRSELHVILDKYQLAKPKTVFHGCHSSVDIFFKNWFVDERKIYNNVYSRDVACYGLDLLEYYHIREDNSYVLREGFFTSFWEEYDVYIP